MTEIVEIAAFHVIDVKFHRSKHDPYATVTLSRVGFKDQQICVELEEGERAKALMEGSNVLRLQMRKPVDYSKRPPNARLIPCS